MPLIWLSRFFKPAGFSVEGSHRHIAGAGGLGQRHFLGSPRLMNAVEVLGQGERRAAEADASCLGGGNAFGLALADVGTFILCHKGQHLQYNVT